MAKGFSTNPDWEFLSSSVMLSGVEARPIISR
jgi:hypothetical protein